MASKWYELKGEAVRLRKRGLSIGKIERRLGIRRSTLSGWLKNIPLSVKQKKKLLQDWKNGLVKARKKAVLWHNAQKEKRLQEAKEGALKILEEIDSNNQVIHELALAMLYIREGSKKALDTALGSSDALLLQFFLAILRRVYKVDENKIRCELSLRADQDPQKMKRYWSRVLKIPIGSFKRVNLDKRTAGVKTYSYYKGVCNIRCGTVAIQRRLVNIGNLYCKQVIDRYLGS